MGVTCKVPELRFCEFSKEFNMLELDNLIEVSSKKINPKITNKNYKCIELEHISQGTGELLGYTFSKDQASTKNLFISNQVLFGKLRPYLKKFLQPKFNGVCSSEIWVLNGKEIINDYLFQLVQTSKFNLIANVSSGSKMPRADWKYMSQIPFLYPSKQEQEKIASFLSSVDSRIEQLTKKEQLLREYKKGVMQKIFSQELRFHPKGISSQAQGNDDNGSEFPEWVEKNGNEIFKTITNKRHNSDLPILAISQEFGAIPRHLIDYKITVTEKSVSTYKVVEIGDFIISLRSFQGGIEYSNYQGICSPAYIILRAFIEINNQFYKNYFKTDRYIQLLNRTIEGIRDGKMISYKQFSEIKLPFPSLKEQTKIANFLSSLDMKIDQANKELNLTKEFKKALLQKMFV